jgi:hypothetical protein
VACTPWVLAALAHPIRLMVGLQLLKHTCNVSDEEVVATWVENPYWQYFCGEQYLRHDLPIDPSFVRGSMMPTTTVAA